MINENLRNGNLQESYKYELKGYVRLAKKIDLPHKITLEYFYANKVIDPKVIRDAKSYTPYIWLDAPFCKYILGVYQFIEVTRPIEPILFFLADEIYDFEKTNQFRELFFSGKSAPFFYAVDDAIFNDEENAEIIKSKNLSLDDNHIAVDENIKHEETPKNSCGNFVINKFHKKGNCYEIDYAGDKFILKTSKGLEYIEHLFRNAFKEIHVQELERVINRSPALTEQKISLNEAEEAGLNDTSNVLPDDVADEKAIKTVKAALKSKEEELKIANEEGQIELAEDLQEEIEQLKKYLNGALGKNYKPRKIPDENEKARKRVQDAIKNARNIIKPYNQPLFEHLFQFIRTGYFCVYKPTSPVEWVIVK